MAEKTEIAWSRYWLRNSEAGKLNRAIFSRRAEIAPVQRFPVVDGSRARDIENTARKQERRLRAKCAEIDRVFPATACKLASFLPEPEGVSDLVGFAVKVLEQSLMESPNLPEWAGLDDIFGPEGG